VTLSQNLLVTQCCVISYILCELYETEMKLLKNINKADLNNFLSFEWLKDVAD